jgi:hypothetical protein
LQLGDKSDFFSIPHSVEVCGFMDSVLEHSEMKKIFDSVSGTNVTVLAISTDTARYEKGDWADIFNMLPRQVEHLFLELDSCYEYDDHVEVTNYDKALLTCDSKLLARLRSFIHKDTKIHLLKAASNFNLHCSMNLLCP